LTQIAPGHTYLGKGDPKKAQLLMVLGGLIKTNQNRSFQ